MKRSTRVIAEGGLPMFDDIKARSQGIVRVITDDTEITLGHLLGQNRHEIKVGIYTPTRTDLTTRETGRRYRSQIIAVTKSRIESMAVLG
jgi:hypothetical protein